jgi:quinol-cytochrome oxidoreductase complex cytochrome b subunit
MNNALYYFLDCYFLYWILFILLFIVMGFEERFGGIVSKLQQEDLQ